MTTNKISSIECSETRDLKKNKIPLHWEWKESVVLNWSNIDSSNKKVVCVMSSQIKNDELIKKLYDYAKNHIDVYIVTDEMTHELSRLTDKCLIRTGIDVKGSMILFNPMDKNCKGYIFSVCSFIESSECIVKQISKEKIKDLFRFFCYMFWEKTTKEYIENKEGADIKDKAVDVYLAPSIDTKYYIFDCILGPRSTCNREDCLDQYITITKDDKSQSDKIETYKIEEKQSIEIKDGIPRMDKLLPKQEMEKIKPNESEFIDDQKHLIINYSWYIDPFYLPKFAKEHSLYERWEKEEKKIKQTIDDTKERINRLSSDEKLEQIRKCLDDLSEISSWRLDDNLVNDYDKLQEYRNIVLTKENEKKKNKIHEEIETIKKKEEEIQKEIDTIKNKKNEIQKEIETNKEKENKIHKERKKGNEIQKEIETIKKLKKDLNQKIDEIEKELKNKQGIKNKIVVNRSKKQKDLSEIEKEIKKIEKEGTNKKIDIERLPKVGHLYKDNNKDYLAISSWDEYDKAKEECERLNAKLCAQSIDN